MRFQTGCVKLMQPCFFMCCTFTESDLYSADAPGSIPTLLIINTLSLYGCSMEQPHNPVYGETSPILPHPLLRCFRIGQMLGAESEFRDTR